MFSVWRPLCLHATTIRCLRISRVTYSKEGLLSSWALRETFKSHVTNQLRHSSCLVKHVIHEGFRTHSGIFIKSGDTVELKDGTFLRVVEVLHNKFYRHWIVGRRFVRNTETRGLPRQPNEVYWVVHLTKNDPRLAAEQALVEVDDSQILRKRTMTMVNTTYPESQKGTGADLGVPSDGALFCRWKHIILTEIGKRNRPLDAFKIPAAGIAEASFQRLRTEECDGGRNNRIADETLCRSWRGVTKRRGAGNESKESSSLLSAVEALSLNDKGRNERVPAAYTFADVCCGAGGASRGAEMAGLQLCWALDHNAAACETFRLNFPEVRLYHKELKDVVHMRREGFKIDIMHMSPPCQPFSSANTTPSLKNDTVNIAANMEICNCLDMARPRIATLEQTPGLMSKGYVGGRHSEHWDKLIKHFTSRGYSVAWEIIDLAELGLPQHRKRLIMIASCPGEAIPHFPEPTHAKDPSKTGLKRFTSVKEAIGDIPRGCPNHKTSTKLETRREVFNENGPLPQTITTHRSDTAHPNGRRTFSLRELACLQGLPLKHRFPETAKAKDTMTQIGNAFPPIGAAVLYGSIKHQLLTRDGLKPQ